jgi:PIN domain nuclease of toxin-antitoxin system
VILLDTHVLVWAVHDDARLGRKARAIIEDCTRNNHVLVSAITPWEIAMLSDKGRLVLNDDVARWIDRVLALPGIRLAVLEPQIAVGSVRLPGSFHPDPADRMIVATARFHQVPLMTADQAILDYGEEGHVDVLPASQ